MTHHDEAPPVKGDPHPVCREIGVIHVHLRGDDPQVLDDFAHVYSPHSSCKPDEQKVVELEVRRSGRSRLGRRLFRVYADGEEIGGPQSSDGVFPLIEWGINLRVIETRPEYLQLHAASMVRGGRGFIFAGDSGCGKSTLAAILLAHGWQYLCDEFALVDADSLHLQPFPKALCIKADSHDVVRDLGLPFARRRDYLKAVKGRVGYVNARAVGADRIAGPAPVKFVVFPRYERGADAGLTPIGRAEAVMSLYACGFNKWAFPAKGLPLLTDLVRGVKCFRLTVGNPAETVQLLEALCTHPSRTCHIRAAGASPRTRHSRHRARARCSEPSGDRHLRSRRDVLLRGAKVAFIAPAVLTLTARQAFAVMSNPSSMCSTAKHTGELCETDSDCCTRKCNLGVCG